MKNFFTPKIRILWSILALLNLIYAITVFLVGSGTMSFIIWIFGAFFFCFLFFLAGNGRWARFPKTIRKISYILLVSVTLLTTILMVCMFSHFGDKGEKDLDYIVVLGAQMRSHGPSVIFKYRLDAAYDYMVENPDTICIISGAQGSNENISEGQGGKDYLVSKGISEDRIIAETKALDTVQNISYSMDIIEEMDSRSPEDITIGVVTNNYHLFRGIHIAMGESDSQICGIAGYTVPRFLPNNMVRECFGIIRDLSKMGF